MAFNLLSEPIRKYLYDKGWEQLRPIQIAAIERILTTNNNYILSSRTASGKTEAAFLPILSKVNFNEIGVQVLYISPLIALINDQFFRIEELCKYLDVSITKWHGEANRTLKTHLVKNPSGIVLITPESLEAMFVNRTFYVKGLFSNLKYIVVDEIHSFIGTDRGVHLKSIISRLQNIQSKPFIIVGLSATIGDFNEAKCFTGNELNTKVLLDRTIRPINAHFRFFEQESEELPIDLLKDLYFAIKNDKVLIFPNSRGRAEEVAVKLMKISEKENGHQNYFSHHSSIDREIREYVEYFAKNSIRQNFCISCTSTLELGIDIGTVDEVVQIDSTNSVTSLIQRVGRSGRTEGESSNLFLYATDQWNLLQSLACWLLYTEGFIEPPLRNQTPYDILLHQTLSITKGHSEIRLNDLREQLNKNSSFNQIDISEIDEIIFHLIKIDLLEKLGQEIIIGVEGEKIVNNHEFYSVFKTEENFKVINAGNTIGAIPFSPQIKEDENIFLAARIWKIISVDFEARKIDVIRASDGNKPKFFGSGSEVHSRIREKMLEILNCDTVYDVLNQQCLSEISKMRKDFAIYQIQDIKIDRPFLYAKKNLQFYTFTSTKINHTIDLLFDLLEIESSLDDKRSMFEFKLSRQNFLKNWESISKQLINLDSYLDGLLAKNLHILSFSKWGVYLPQKFQIKLIKDQILDIPGTEWFLNSIRLIENI